MQQTLKHAGIFFVCGRNAVEVLQHAAARQCRKVTIMNV